MKERIENLTIEIPYRREGNVIVQEPVKFELYRADGFFSLCPCLNEDERRIANLPEELNFTLEDGEPVSLRGIKDGNLHVIQDAVKQLQDRKEILY